MTNGNKTINSMEISSTEVSRAEIRQRKDGSYSMAGYELPPDHTFTFTGDGKVTVLHIPFKDLHKIAILLNEFLQSKGIESIIEKKSGW